MERVHAAIDTPADQITGVAVSITANRLHLGVLHRSDSEPSLVQGEFEDDLVVEDGEVRLLHLGWHDSFHNDPGLSDCAYWIDPDLEPEQHDAVAGICRLIADLYGDGEFPYGFGSPDGFFSEEGEMLPPGAELGLTCATFVVAVFHRAGVPLVRCDTWRFREADRPRLVQLVEMLRRSGAPPEHVERQVRAIEQGQARFRPLEIAGAATSSELPVSMEIAEKLAEALEAELNRLDASRGES